MYHTLENGWEQTLLWDGCLLLSVAWKVAVIHCAGLESQGKFDGETHVFFVGSQNAVCLTVCCSVSTNSKVNFSLLQGKTTIILRFLERWVCTYKAARLVQTLFFDEASCRVHTDILVWGQDYSWLCDWSLSHYCREEPPKPTTGLEYTYGRRSRGANIVRVNCKLLHSWGCSGMHSNCSLIPNKNAGGISRTRLFVCTHHFKWKPSF